LNYILNYHQFQNQDYCWPNWSKISANLFQLFVGTIDKIRYDDQIKQLEGMSSALKKPKKCLSAYMIFVKETRPRIVEENPNLGALDIMKKVG